MTQDERRLRKVMVVRVSRGQYAALEGAAAREQLLVSAWAWRVLARAAEREGGGRRRSPHPWALSPRRNLPDSDSSRPASQCHKHDLNAQWPKRLGC